MKGKSPLQQKSFAFALRMIELSKYLVSKREYVFSDQILRSGTSIGANIEEGLGGHSKKEFSLEISISYKEARETLYWLNLLKESEIITNEQAASLLKDCEELLRMLGIAKITLRSTTNQTGQ